MSESPNASPFESAAPYYDAYRAPYAPAALDHVVAAFGLTAGRRVLDLGCGPGTIAIPLSQTGAEVVAIDRDAVMLSEAKRLAGERGAGSIQWLHGRAEDLLSDLGQFDVVTLGQSLHWMDRDFILRRLADVVMDGGGLAILDEGRGRLQPSWEAVAVPVMGKYIVRRGRHPGKHPETAHEPSLLRSSHFSNFTVREFPFAITRDIASILGCVYSSVSSTKPMFGDELHLFERDLTEALLRTSPSGVFEEKIETAVYLAPKRIG